jgi:hypothetical protein
LIGLLLGHRAPAQADPCHEPQHEHFVSFHIGTTLFADCRCANGELRPTGLGVLTYEG